MKQYVMGNGAIGLGALAAGVGLASGYPGTPSSEIIDAIAARAGGGAAYPLRRRFPTPCPEAASVSHQTASAEAAAR